MGVDKFYCKNRTNWKNKGNLIYQVPSLYEFLMLSTKKYILKNVDNQMVDIVFFFILWKSMLPATVKTKLSLYGVWPPLNLFLQTTFIFS